MPMTNQISRDELRSAIADKLCAHFGVTAETATDEQVFQAAAIVIREILSRLHTFDSRTAPEREVHFHRIRLLIEYTSAAQQHHCKAGSDECRPFFPCRFSCCHIDHRSFPHFTAGENAAHIVRRSFFKGRGQPLLHFFVSHRASSPSRVLRIFFNAL